MRYDDNVKEAVHWAVLLQLGLRRRYVRGQCISAVGWHGMGIPDLAMDEQSI